MNSDPNQVGIKHDQNKPKFSLIPQRALEFVARVVTFGAKKYGPRNWVKTENLSERYTDAAMRHINAYLQGAPNDLETGLPHLAHAVTSLMFVIEHDTGALSEPQYRLAREQEQAINARKLENMFSKICE